MVAADIARLNCLHVTKHASARQCLLCTVHRRDRWFCKLTSPCTQTLDKEDGPRSVIGLPITDDWHVVETMGSQGKRPGFDASVCKFFDSVNTRSLCPSFISSSVNRECAISLAE